MNYMQLEQARTKSIFNLIQFFCELSDIQASSSLYRELWFREVKPCFIEYWDKLLYSLLNL